MSNPILVRPGLIYEIRTKQNPPEDCAIGTPLKSEVRTKNGITVQFHDDAEIPEDFSKTGLIWCLYFLRTE